MKNPGLHEALNALLATARQGALLREGLRVVIAGQPNVGKSSLLNALAGAELAIVTPIPGTTRDRVSESIQIEGVPVHVTDTAGLRRDEQAADEAGAGPGSASLLKHPPACGPPGGGGGGGTGKMPMRSS